MIGSRFAARRLALVISLANLGFLVCLAAGLLLASPWALMEGLPLWLRAAGWIPWLTVPLSLGLPVRLAGAFGSDEWTPLGRLYCAVLIAAAAGFAGFVWSWNLFGLARV